MGAPILDSDSPEVIQRVIKAVCSVVAGRTGVQFGARQMNMVESRLRRRISELQLGGFSEYHEYLRANPAVENEALVSLLTTHHTYFFREFVQFEFLESSLPALTELVKARQGRTLDLWSAACSRGQEVYSLSMYLRQHLARVSPGLGYSIYGSDVDKESVDIAANGVYRRQEIKEVPLTYLGQNWAGGTGEIADFVKAKKVLREHCTFGVQNLLDLKGLENRKFDVIFCRNVFIYFTAEQIKQITLNMIRHLHPGGLFLVGLSESLHGQGLPLKAIGPSVYTHLDSVTPKPARPAEKTVPAPKTAAPVPVAIPDPLRVVCIDDSSTILALLKKILGRDHGFEVVGTALDGEEGAQLVQQLKPHLVTLDIHMPVCTGIEYLRKHHGSGRPPVVMVTSVSRDDAGLALQAISLGASDYVEKPALNNLEHRADELRAKLRTAFRAKEVKTPLVDKEFARTQVIPHPEQCARLLVFTLSDLDKCAAAIRESQATKVPTYVAVEGADTILPEIRERLGQAAGTKVTALENGGPLAGGALRPAVAAVNAGKFKHVSVMVFGEISVSGAREVLGLPGAQILLEDLGQGKGTEALARFAADTVPSTSFSYLADEFFAAGKKG